jgi:hypothetical protein
MGAEVVQPIQQPLGPPLRPRAGALYYAESVTLPACQGYRRPTETYCWHCLCEEVLRTWVERVVRQKLYEKMRDRPTRHGQQSLTVSKDALLAKLDKLPKLDNFDFRHMIVVTAYTLSRM